jgi:cupin fold WbuC family metalloprotein
MHLMKKVEFIDHQKLDEISLKAKASPRLRMNYNFHSSDHDLCHRLLNAMEPDSYIQPHRHLDINKDETLMLIRGKLGLIIFDDQGSVQAHTLIEPNGDNVIVNIPSGTYHTWLSLEEGSVFFEAKAGPYKPLAQDEKAPWSPEENTALSTQYLKDLKILFT